MFRHIDLSGQRIGNWTVISRSPQASRHLYWLCRCDCGREEQVYGYNLRKGRSSKCHACGAKAGGILKQKPHSSLKRLYRDYQHGAANRDLLFSLPLEEFAVLIQQPCHYCGIQPAQTIRANNGDALIYNGVDRIDSSRGYYKDNVVSSCGVCNRAKRDMGYTGFLSWLDQLVSYRGALQCVS